MKNRSVWKGRSLGTRSPRPSIRDSDSSQILGSCNRMALSHAQISVALLE